MKRIIISLLIFSFFGIKLFAQIKNDSALEMVGRTWGFLKYYHPELGQMTINWDSLLVSKLPDDAKTISTSTATDIIEELLHSVGDVPDCSTCNKEFGEQDAINLNWSWIKAGKYLRTSQAKQLMRIRDHRQPAPNLYIQDWIKTNGSFRINEFVMDAQYDSWSLMKDYRYRLAALFHYWNVIEYFFPYKHSANPDWDLVLRKGLDRFMEAGSAAALQMAMLWLSNQLNDSHANGSTSSFIVQNLFGNRKLPLDLLIIEDSLVLVRDITSDSLAKKLGIQPGDELVGADGKPIFELFQADAPYVAASHPEAKNAYLCYYFTVDTQQVTRLGFRRGGKLFEQTVQRYSFQRLADFQQEVSHSLVRTVGPNKEFLYLSLEKIPSKAELKTFIKGAKKSKGIVLDLRHHGMFRGTAMKLTEIFCPPDAPLAIEFHPDYDYPGSLSNRKMQRAKGNLSKDLAALPLVLLVGNNVLSRDEYFIMHLQTHPKSYTIGTPTGGALATLGRVSMPLGFKAHFTQHGMTYPDGTAIFGKGVKLDRRIFLTKESIAQQQDLSLEEAIKYLTQ